jgi:hypothetical protein
MSDDSPTRRTVLTGLSALLASSICLDEAFAAEPPERQLQLFAAWHQARREGRDVLAIVIPGYGLTDRGRIIGGALDEAGDRLLAALSAYVPVCATPQELHMLGAVVPEDAWFAILPTQAVPARITTFVGTDQEDLARAVEQTKNLLRQVLRARAPDDRPTTSVGKRATEGEKRWVTSRLPGSHWASLTGCGYHVEDFDGSMGFACGMGSVPERYARFLVFLNETYR